VLQTWESPSLVEVNGPLGTPSGYFADIVTIAHNKKHWFDISLSSQGCPLVRLSASPHVYHFEFESFEALLPGGIILRFALQGGDHRIRDFASRGFSAKIRTLILSEVTVSIAFKSFAAAFFSPRLSDTRS